MNKSIDSVNDIIDKIFRYYELFGEKDYIGEEITQNEHMIQGAMFAEKDEQPIEVVIALFLHDIGHLIQLEIDEETIKCPDKRNSQRMGDYGSLNHEVKGRMFLENIGIPYPIPKLVENHVKTKRYLVYKNPEYYQKLSSASKMTLCYQGGPMNLNEVAEFENDPLFEMSLTVREYDEKSKLKNLKLNSLDYYRDMIRHYLLKD